MQQDGCLPLRYDKNTIYIIGDAKTAQNNPITLHYNNRFFITLIIDVEREIIVDAGASVMIAITTEFVRSMFVGYSMKLGLDSMVEEIMRRYYGGSQTAMIVAWKDAYKKYQQIRKRKI
jgi:hypothetical protein